MHHQVRLNVNVSAIEDVKLLESYCELSTVINQIGIVAFNVPQLKQPSFLQKNQTRCKMFF